MTYLVLRRKLAFVTALVVVAVFMAGSCGQDKEVNRLESENRALRDSVVSLAQELSTLRDAPENCYEHGIEFLNSGRYPAASSAFTTLAQKYPTSPLAGKAKEQLAKLAAPLAAIKAQQKAEEKRRQQEERRRQEAAAPWPYAGIRVKVMDDYGNISRGTVMDRPPIELDRVMVALDDGSTCEVRWMSLGSQLSESDFGKFSQALDRLRRQWDEK